MKRRIKRRPYRKDLSAVLLPEPARDKLTGDLGQLRHEVIGLRAENEALRPLKTEIARLRAGIADDVYEASEKILGE